MANSGAIGIDFGSLSSVIATVRTGGVDVLTNGLSHRSTPSIVGFGDKQRYMGESGASRVNMNFRNTVLYPNRLLGLPSTYGNLHEETKWLTNRLINTDEGIAHEVRYMGDTMAFTPEKVVAMYLNHLKEIALKNGVGMSDVVISVPCYYTETERKAMLSAAEIADIPCVKIMNDTTALCLSYGLFRISEFTDQPRIVAFADMGHSKFTCTIASFTAGKLQVLAHAAERNLGGRDLDYIVMEYFATSFDKKYGVNPMSNPKSRVKLANAVERLRKVLSANNEANISVEYLIEDYDLNGVLKRDEFEVLVQSLLEKLRAVCERAKAIAGVDAVHSVEIVGGCTRIPSVQQILCNVFGLESVSKTLNSDEAVARGCAIQAAMLSPLYKVKDFSITDIVYMPISFAISPIEMDEDVPYEVLFTEKNPFPVTKIISLQKNAPFKVDFTYASPLPEGLESHIGTFAVLAAYEEAEYPLKIHIKMNKHGLVNLEQAERIETYYEEVPVEEVKEEKKEGEEAAQETEKAEGEEKKEEKSTKTKKKTRKTPLEVSATVKGLSPNVIQQLRMEEQKMANEDRIAVETLEKKNEVESFVYDWRHKLESTHKEFSTPDQVTSILGTLRETEDWIYGDGQDTLKSVYIEKLDSLNQCTASIAARHNFYSMVPSLEIELRQTCQQAVDFAASKDEQYSHISEEDRQTVVAKAQESLKWLEEAMGTVSSTNRTEMPSVKMEEFVKVAQGLRDFANQVMCKPKPAPPKPAEAEKPPEEAPKPEEQPQPDQAPQEDQKMDVD